MRWLCLWLICGSVVAGGCGSTQPERASHASDRGSTLGHDTSHTTVTQSSTSSSSTGSSLSPSTSPSSQSLAVQDAARGAALLRVDHVVDGDTIAMADGQRVRMAQIDTPEKYGSPECYGQQASAVLRSLLPNGARVRLVRDPYLDATDRYGRRVRYVYVGSVNVNLVMVRRGAASVWFYQGTRGIYARSFARAAAAARRSKRGLWGACAGTTFDPEHGVDTGADTGVRDAAVGAATASTSASQIPAAPPYPPDVDCSDLPGPVRVTPDDPHRLDRDGDGIGCNR